MTDATTRDANGVMRDIYDPELHAIRVDGDATGGGAVSSVNGQTGDVVLDYTDVGADPVGAAAAVDTALDDHLNDATDAHDASAISVDTTGFSHSSASNAQLVLADLDAAMGGGTGVTDGDKGDITVSSSGAVWTVDNDVVTNAKAANMATATIKGRATAGTGDPEDLTASQARTLLSLVPGTDVEVHNANLTTIAGLSPSNDDFLQRKAGAWANRTVAQVKSDLSLTGTNSGDQTITLTGDVTGSGTGSFAATIANDAVTYAKMQNVSATSRFLGRKTAGAGDPEELTASDAKTILAIAESDVTNLTTDLAARVQIGGGLAGTATTPAVRRTLGPFSQSGALTTGVGTMRLPLVRTSTIIGVRAMVGTAPTGASLIVDVNKNGTTIFTTQGNRPTITATNTDSGSGSTPDVTSLSAGDYITVDIDQVGSTVAGSDLVVVIEVTST